MDYAAVTQPDGVVAVAEAALEQRGGHSATYATNAVFHHITGVDPYQLAHVLINGAPIGSAVTAREVRESLAQLLDIRLKEAGALLGASESRFSRNDELDQDMLDRAHAIINTYMNVAAALGPRGAAGWFSVPHPALDNEPPVRLLLTSYGRSLVSDLVSALHSGSYI